MASSTRFWISPTRYLGKAVMADSIKALSGMIYLKVIKRVTAASLQLAELSLRINATSFSLIERKMLPTRSFCVEMLWIKGIIVCSMTNCFTLGFLWVEAI